MSFSTLFKSILHQPHISSKLLNALPFIPEEPCEAWWGKFDLAEGETRSWTVGTSHLTVQRFQYEWRSPSQRILMTTQAQVLLTPHLGTSPLAVRLIKPLHIPVDQPLFVYVIAPIWISLYTTNPTLLIDEKPSLPLKETWFGDNTREGELCYSGPLEYGSQLSELIYQNYQIIIPILLNNGSREEGILKRLYLPFPSLSIFVDGHNRLWTEQLNMEWQGHHYPEIHINPGPPRSVPDIQKLRPASANIHPKDTWLTACKTLLRKAF